MQRCCCWCCCFFFLFSSSLKQLRINFQCERMIFIGERIFVVVVVQKNTRVNSSFVQIWNFEWDILQLTCSHLIKELQPFVMKKKKRVKQSTVRFSHVHKCNVYAINYEDILMATRDFGRRSHTMHCELEITYTWAISLYT